MFMYEEPREAGIILNYSKPVKTYSLLSLQLQLEVVSEQLWLVVQLQLEVVSEQLQLEVVYEQLWLGSQSEQLYYIQKTRVENEMINCTDQCQEAEGQVKDVNCIQSTETLREFNRD